MKTIYTLILSVLLSTALFAQGNFNQQNLNQLNHNATVKPLYDSIDEWPDPSHTLTISQYLNTSFNYDANGNLLSDVFKQDTGAGYGNQSKEVNTYLSGNLLTTSISQLWGYSLGWVNSNKSSYTYIANKYPDSTLEQYWKSNSWHDTTLIFYQYNSTNLDTCATHQLFKGGNWLNYYRYLYFYNANGADTCTIQQTWNGSSWVNSAKNSTYYNSNNIDTLDLSLTWIDTAAYWGNNGKTRHIINTKNLDSVDIIILGSFHYWGNPYEEISYTYDSHNNLIYCAAGSYPGTSGVLYENIAYAYDINNILLSTMTTSAPFHQDSIHYYFHQVVGVEFIMPTAKIGTYPNPSSETFTIDNRGNNYSNCIIEVYNMAGQQIFATMWNQFNTPQHIALNGPNGMYILRFRSDQGISYNKLEINK